MNDPAILLIAFCNAAEDGVRVLAQVGQGVARTLPAVIILQPR